MDRRTVLRSAGAAACLVAGCATSPATERAHHIEIRNSTASSRTAGVIIEGDSGALFNHRYELEPAASQAGYGFYGEPTTITVVLDDDSEYQFEYANVRCSGRKLVGVVVTIMTPGEVDISYECEMIQNPTASNGNASRL